MYTKHSYKYYNNNVNSFLELYSYFILQNKFLEFIRTKQLTSNYLSGFDYLYKYPKKTFLKKKKMYAKCIKKISNITFLLMKKQI